MQRKGHLYTLSYSALQEVDKSLARPNPLKKQLPFKGEETLPTPEHHKRVKHLNTGCMAQEENLAHSTDRRVGRRALVIVSSKGGRPLIRLHWASGRNAKGYHFSFIKAKKMVAKKKSNLQEKKNNKVQEENEKLQQID